MRKADRRDLQRFRWVQDLLEILENSAAPDDFLENTKLELYQDQVFCFTPKGAADPAAARRHAGRFRLRGAQPGRRRLRRRQGQRPAAAAAPPVAERRPGRDHDRARRHALAAMGTLRRHRQGARAHPPLRPSSSSASSIIDAGRAALAKAFRQDGLDGSEKAAGSRAEAAEAGRARRAVHRGRQRQLSARGCRARRLSGAAPPPRIAARCRCRPRGRSAPARCTAGRTARRLAQHRRCRSPAWSPGMAYPLRRLLPPAAGRRDRRHRHHRQGRDDPRARLPDAGRLRRHPGALHRCRLGYEALGQPPGSAGRRSHRAISVIAAHGRRWPTDECDRKAGRRHRQAEDQSTATADFIEVLLDVDVRDLRASANVIARRCGRRPTTARCERRVMPLTMILGLGNDICDIRRIEKVHRAPWRALPRPRLHPDRARQGGAAHREASAPAPTPSASRRRRRRRRRSAPASAQGVFFSRPRRGEPAARASRPCR